MKTAFLREQTNEATAAIIIDYPSHALELLEGSTNAYFTPHTSFHQHTVPLLSHQLYLKLPSFHAFLSKVLPWFSVLPIVGLH